MPNWHKTSRVIFLTKAFMRLDSSFRSCPRGARIRPQLSAAHEKHHLDAAIEAFKKVAKKHGILELGRKELMARVAA